MKADYLKTIPEIAPLLAGADVVDIKICESSLPLRAFIAGLLSYQPRWVTALYGVRWVFVRLLGMKQSGVPRQHTFQPSDIAFEKGAPATFFRVEAAQDERYWFAGISEAHLTAHLGVVVEPLEGECKRFYVVTLVHYNNWTGPIYFNVIRPFHHVVVHQMMRAGVRFQGA